MPNKTLPKILLLTTLLLSGCGALLPPAAPQMSQIHERIGTDIIIETRSGTGFILNEEKFNDWTCRTPSPDVLSGTSTSASLSVKGQSMGEASSFAANDLGGRSPAVLISREILYRLCEMASNLRLTKHDALPLFMEGMATVKQITMSEHGSGTTSSNEVDAAPPTASGNNSSDADSETTDETTTDNETETGTDSNANTDTETGTDANEDQGQ